MASEMRKYKKQGRAEAKEYLRAKKEARLEGQEAYDEFAASVKQQKKDFKARMKSAEGEEKRGLRKQKKAFLKRKRRGRRLLSWFLVLALIAGAVYINLGPIKTAYSVYSSQRGFTDTDREAEKARTAGRMLSEEAQRDSAVLLKNKEFLPLEAGTKINVFSGPGIDQEALIEALGDKGFSCNTKLSRAQTQKKRFDLETIENRVRSLLNGGEYTADWTKLGDKDFEEALSFSDLALIILPPEDGDLLGETMPVRAETLRRVLSGFDKVIIAADPEIKSDLSFINGYESIKGALLSDTKGFGAMPAIADIVSGASNPSGRTAFTYSGNSKEESFPLGWGLSYTEFDVKLSRFVSDYNLITAEADITNRGSVPGKEAVGLWFMREGSASGMRLLCFEKTETLVPGETERVTLSVPVRDMAEYSEKEHAFILSKGKYDIAVTGDALSAKDDGDYITYEVATDVKYDNDALTDVEYSDLSAENGIEEGYEIIPASGASNGLFLDAMKGLSYDDPVWDSFLDEFSLDEMITLVSNGAWHTEENLRLGIKKTESLCALKGIEGAVRKLDAVDYLSPAALASSWNDDLAMELGRAIGREAKTYGLESVYAPDTAPGVLSDDPLLAGKIAAAEIRGIQSSDCAAFAVYSKEISVSAVDKTLRETELKSLEIAIKEGIPAGAAVPSDAALIKSLMRAEWGFEGLVSTRKLVSSEGNILDMLKAGSDIFFDPCTGRVSDRLRIAYRNDPAAVSNLLREAVHRICYTIANRMYIY